MGIVEKLFRRKSVAEARPTQAEIQVDCPHTTLMGRWDSVADMGKDDKATAFVCDSCGVTFPPEEGRRLRETTIERLNTEEVERARLRLEESEAAED